MRPNSTTNEYDSYDISPSSEFSCTRFCLSDIWGTRALSGLKTIHSSRGKGLQKSWEEGAAIKITLMAQGEFLKNQLGC